MGIAETIKRLPLARSLYQFPRAVGLYHLAMAFLGALLHGFPSRKMIVVGVTGTKGKTTTCNLIGQILTSAGFRVGVLTTVNIKIAEKEFINRTKQTMPGRFGLQKLLSEMEQGGCQYAVVETSSEGILQHRHRFIDYRVAVFTNLSPEHIERHGSFERYRDAKTELFKIVARRSGGIGVYNLDDKNVLYFLKPNVKVKYGYGQKASGQYTVPIENKYQISNVKLGRDTIRFRMAGKTFEAPLRGEFNVYNAAAAICTALSQGVSAQTIQAALREARQIPGRMELVNKGQKFTVVVDYAHEPASLEAAYKALKLFRPKKIIGLLGAQGGGRDMWKRPAMGKVAADYCNEIVLTNEDPYDEDPMSIMNDVERGILGEKKKRVSVYKIIDRKDAIRKAISLARPGDAVLLTGKGGEVWMCVEGERKIPWDEKRVVEEILQEANQGKINPQGRKSV